jgi:hypothetical protein
MVKSRRFAKIVSNGHLFVPEITWPITSNTRICLPALRIASDRHCDQLGRTWEIAEAKRFNLPCQWRDRPRNRRQALGRTVVPRKFN